MKRRVLSGIALLIWTLSGAASAAPNLSADEVQAGNCRVTPANFKLDAYWDGKVGLTDAWCDYFTITQWDIDGARKPRAFVYASSGSNHDLAAVEILRGQGLNGKTLGSAPRTGVTFGAFCNDPLTVYRTGKPGDVIFSLREWSSSCSIVNSKLPTIPIIGISNDERFVGNTRQNSRIIVSSGANYGLAVDYFMPGNGGGISFGVPGFAGLVVALNTALLTKGRQPLTMHNIKRVLDASSDEVYMKVGGALSLRKESQVETLLKQPGSRYYGQLVNLPRAIEYALAHSSTGFIPAVDMLLLE